jgi:pimeloyl-ACP methyl ester carboxylesterase
MALLDHLHIPKVSIIGWSDGANTGLEIAMRHSSRLDRLFAFGANARPDQGNVEGVKGMVFARELSERIQREFGEISPPPGGYQVLRDRIREMQGREPMWGMEDFARIPVLGRDDGAPLVWLASAEREELVLPKTTWEIRDSVSAVGDQFPPPGC